MEVFHFVSTPCFLWPCPLGFWVRDFCPLRPRTRRVGGSVCIVQSPDGNDIRGLRSSWSGHGLGPAWRLMAGACTSLRRVSIDSLSFPIASCGISVRVGQCPTQTPLWCPVPEPLWVIGVSVATAKSGSKNTRARLAAGGLGCIWWGRPPQFSESQWQCSISTSSSLYSRRGGLSGGHGQR